MKKNIFHFMVSLLILTVAMTAQPLPVQADTPLDKLGRGVANFFTGWLEIYHQAEYTTRTSGAAAGATTGLAKGVLMGIYRMGVGFFEAATFPFPFPDGYEPVIYPEFVPINSGYTHPDRTIKSY